MIYPGYFATMGIPILAGRDFDARDLDLHIRNPSDPGLRVGIVNETFARVYCPDADPIGRRIALQLNRATGPVTLLVPLRGVSSAVFIAAATSQSLKGEFRRKLKNSWRHACRRDDTEGCRGRSHVRSVEVNVVEDVERLAA